MRRLGALLCACAALLGCDDGPGDDSPADAVAPHDMQPDPVMDADTGDVEATDDGVVDPEPEPDADASMPETCVEPDAVISAMLPLQNRARRVELPGLATRTRLAPACDDDPARISAGAEYGIRIVPDTDGEHLIIAVGRLSAAYRIAPCVDGEPIRILGCLVADGPFEDGATLGARVVLRAGEAFDIIADSPAERRAGPLAVLVYPPVAEGGDCSPIGDSATRPSCEPETACRDDRCVYVGPPRVDRLEAWSDGQSLRVEAHVAGGGLVRALWATTGVPAPMQLFLTAVDERPGGVIFRGYAEEPALAAADSVDIEIVDTDERKARRTIGVAKLDALPAGSPCDPNGMRDTCDMGDACVDGQCRGAEVGAWLTDAGLNLDVHLPAIPVEAPRMTAAFRASDAEPEERWSPLPERPTRDGRRWAAPALALPEAGLEVRMHVEGLPPGLPLTVDPQPQPVRRLDEACDIEGFADRCAADLACLPSERGGRCLAIDPPEIERLQGWAGSEALGLKVTYGDPQNDTIGYRLAVFTANGELRFATDDGLRPLPAGADGVFFDSLPAPWQPVRGDVLELQLIDATGQISEPAVARLDVPPEVELGARCDPLGAWAVCVDDESICAANALDAGSVCQRFEEPCPERWRPFPLAAPTRHDDNTSGGPDRTAGACGGAGSPEAIYEVVAEEDARWRISVLPPGATVYVRTHCQFAVPELSELVCARNPFELEVEGDETYYIFVDGPADGGRFALLIDEVDQPIEPPGPDPAD